MMMYSKQKRGEYSYQHAEKKGIIAVRWMDNSVVTVAPTKFGVEPMNSVERYSAKERKRIKSVSLT